MQECFGRISSNSGILDILPFLTLERSDLLSSCPVSLIEECAAEKYRYNSSFP